MVDGRDGNWGPGRGCYLCIREAETERTKNDDQYEQAHKGAE